MAVKSLASWIGVAVPTAVGSPEDSHWAILASVAPGAICSPSRTVSCAPTGMMNSRSFFPPFFFPSLPALFFAGVLGAVGGFADVSARMIRRRQTAHVADTGEAIPNTSHDQVLVQGALETGAAFWHMVDLIWVMLFPVVYLIR